MVAYDEVKAGSQRWSMSANATEAVRAARASCRGGPSLPHWQLFAPWVPARGGYVVGQRHERRANPRDRLRLVVHWRWSTRHLGPASRGARRCHRCARCEWLVLAEGHLTRRLFGGMLRGIVALPSPAG